MAESQALGQRKGSKGEEAKPAGHHQPSWLLQPQWIWVREISLEEDPRAFPTLRKDTGGVASGWSRGHTQCWGEPGRPQRDRRIPVLRTTLEQKAGGLRVGQGGGAPESYSRPSAGPAGKLTAPKRTVYGSRSAQRNAKPGLRSPIRISFYPVPSLTQKGSQPPRVAVGG